MHSTDCMQLDVNKYKECYILLLTRPRVHNKRRDLLYYELLTRLVYYNNIMLIQIARNSAMPNLTAHLTTLFILKRLACGTIVECQVCVAEDEQVSRSSDIVDLYTFKYVHQWTKLTASLAVRVMVSIQIQQVIILICTFY